MSTEEEERRKDWIVKDPRDGIVRVTYVPSGDTYDITVADVRGADQGENEVWGGKLDDYLRDRAINIAAQRRLNVEQ